MTTQKKFRGVAVTDDGTFVCATVVRDSQGWRCGSVRRWSSDSRFRNYLLFHRTVNLALQGHWVRQPTDNAADTISVRTEDDFTVCTSESAYDHFSGLLRSNLRATVPDDAGLATLPPHFSPACQRSFITLRNDNGSIRTGVVIDGRLIFALSAHCDNAQKLQGYLERIRYYCTRSLSLPAFTPVVYTVNTLPFAFPDAETVDCGTEDPNILCAMGAALALQDNAISTPRFSDAFPQEVRMRGVRLALVVTTLLIFFGTAVTSTIFLVHNASLGRKVATAKAAYRDLLNNNVDIRELITTGDSLSRKVLKINKRLSNPTKWGQFLHMLGTKRPDGLFLERLGSEPVSGESTKIRIALGGWCKTETIATDFIKLLSDSPLLNDVTLSSMERVGKPQSICRFKIVCILLTKQK